MYIILGIIIELVTILKSLQIANKLIINAIIELANNGYKIKKESIKDNGIIINISEFTPSEKILNMIKTILLFVPIANIISIIMYNKLMIKNIMNKREMQEIIVPMTKLEKNIYKSITNKDEKFIYIYFVSTKEYEEEVYLGVENGDIKSIDLGRLELVNEKILPLSYTLEEVKRLNKATNEDYLLGKIDGRNIAIIGLSKENRIIKRVNIVQEKTISNFQELKDEEAENSRFVVYPYRVDKIDDIEEVIEEIKEARDKTRLTPKIEPIKTNYYKELVQERILKKSK